MAGLPTGINVVDVVSIGAGGGSIAWVDERGVPQVGPHSAGSSPGPACYGRGGVQPTVTDATLVAGLINPDAYLDGRVKLDRAAALGVIERYGQRFGWSLGAATDAILELTVANMAEALRTVTVERGHDPTRLVMIGYGGTLPMFAAAICERLHMPRVVLPANSSVFSAFGLLVAPFVRRYTRSLQIPLDDGGVLDAVQGIRADMRRQAAREADVAGIGEDDLELDWGAELRFSGQVSELGVALAPEEFTEAHAAALIASFPARYEQSYGPGTAWQGAAVVLVSLTLTATAALPRPAMAPAQTDAVGPASAIEERTVLLAGGNWREGVPVYDGTAITPGMRRRGAGDPGRARHDGIRAGGVVLPPRRVAELRAGAGGVKNARDTSPQEVLRAEVHRKAMDAIALEMGITLVRTSGSPVVTEAKDLSCSVLDDAGEQIGYASFVGTHVSTSFLGVAAVLAAYDVSTVHPGEAFIVNDPHTSGALHEGDVGLIMPYFHEDRLVGWGYVNEHMLDVGGSGVSGFAPEARDCYSEGLRFPALRLMRDGVLDPDWLRFIANNVRASAAVLNDLRSMLAALHTGRGRLAAALEEFGLEAHRRYCAVNKRLSEEMVRGRFEHLPDGRYRERRLGRVRRPRSRRPARARLRAGRRRHEITLRFWGVPQIDAPVNAARPAVMGQAMNTLQTTFLHDVPANAGLWRPVHFDLGAPGTIVNSVPPAAVCFAHVGTGMRIDKLVRDVLTQAMSLSDSARVRGRVAGQPCEGVVLITLTGIERATGRTTVLFPISPTVALGGPAQSTADGLDTYSNTCNIGKRMAAVEMDEATTPVMILWRRIEPSSGGAGITRGGQGMTSALEIRGADEMTGTVSNNCSQVPPRGAGGGMTGACTEYRLLAGHEPRSAALAGPAADAGDDHRPHAPAAAAREPDRPGGRGVRDHQRRRRRSRRPASARPRGCRAGRWRRLCERARRRVVARSRAGGRRRARRAGDGRLSGDDPPRPDRA